jgi:hypothetical protein
MNESMPRETEVLGENLTQCGSLLLESYMT